MRYQNRFFATLAAAAALVTFCGCEDDGGGGDHDFGDNDPNLVICVGDSITQGYACDGAPYPSQLAAMSGKQVRNLGIGGAESGVGASRISSQLSCKPGYVCILYGANDAICGGGAGGAKENIRAIISACKKNKSVPIVATTPPMIGEHGIFNDAAKSINEAIRAVAGEEGVGLVDLYGAFGSGEAYLVSDGLHPNAAGAELIARKFNGAL